MAKSFINYEKELPEIPDRNYWEIPDCKLVKDESSLTGWRVDLGRRESNLLLVPSLRKVVNAWRDEGYPGMSEVTRRLFTYWFKEDHILPGTQNVLRYYFGQREAIETLVWLVEVQKIKDCQELIQTFASSQGNIESWKFQKTTTDQLQLEYTGKDGSLYNQDLPSEGLSRYALRMATGSGKTWVMAMAIVWSFFHKKNVEGSPLSTNFLIVAPNVIVFERLEKDFASSKLFHEIPLIPPEWKDEFSLKVILRGESTTPNPSGNLFLTNIQQMYESRNQEWTPQNAVDSLLGRNPTKDLANSNNVSMLDRVKSLKDLVVINDEAHHVHDQELAWSQSLIGIHKALPIGFSLWLDFSATPKDQNGWFFPWTICDYPLAQAVEDQIIKVPLIIREGGGEIQKQKEPPEPETVRKENVVQKYEFWLQAAFDRWKAHQEIYAKLGIQPVLFIMVEKSAYADEIGKYFREERTFDLKEDEVLVIHTNTSGEITKDDLEKAREAARNIDSPKNKIKVIVSVMMLKEGWDVRNVTVVLGLRPFSSNAEILPEQVIGRGLRLMRGIGPDHLQPLEVLGTPRLLEYLQGELERDGVSITSQNHGPMPPITIEPIQEKMQYDITVPITAPRLSQNVASLEQVNISSLDPVFSSLKELLSLSSKALDVSHATTNATVGTVVSRFPRALSSREVFASITYKTLGVIRLPSHFSKVYPLVQEYITTRCVDGTNGSLHLDEATLRALSHDMVQNRIARYLGENWGRQLIQVKPLQFEKRQFCLSQTLPFTWRRNLTDGPLECTKTVFNYVATYNNFERSFAEFLDEANDVVRFAALGTTEQGNSCTQFKVDYLKDEGAVGFYYPDWIVIQKTEQGEVNWIIETKGRIWRNTVNKDIAMEQWCSQVQKLTGDEWQYIRVNQKEFKKDQYHSLNDLLGFLGG